MEGVTQKQDRKVRMKVYKKHRRVVVIMKQTLTPSQVTATTKEGIGPRQPYGCML